MEDRERERQGEKGARERERERERETDRQTDRQTEKERERERVVITRFIRFYDKTQNPYNVFSHYSGLSLEHSVLFRQLISSASLTG